jgi:GR25 family glycosyltransferase involved in LPS biosynthesis
MIDRVYCINLEKRTDKKAKAITEFRKNGIEGVEFFRGTDGRIEAPEGILITKPEYGCSDSHVRIWRDMIENGYETALVFEDDVLILPDFNSKLEQVFDELQVDPEWDYVNLGPHDWKIKQERVTPLLTKGSSWGSHCYIISQRGARKVAMWDTKDFQFPLDVQIARSPLKMYYCDEPLANQESFSSKFGLGSGSSDIGMQRTTDWDFIIKEFFQRYAIYCVFILALYFIWKMQ